jgi:AcrR family transcriptional regulator
VNRRPRGRRPGDSGTREAILGAARREFAKRGYDGATIRSIAAAAAVDPALVHHFFSTKENLFVAAMQLPFAPADVLPPLEEMERDRVGEALARAALGMWEVPELHDTALGVLRSAFSNEGAARMLREFVARAVVARLAGLAGGNDAELRASLAASQVIGIAVARYAVKMEPLASTPLEELVAAVGPTLQRYLTGGLGA